MKGSDLTVVIPTYRRPRLLARALLSVIEQQVPGLRIRVLDNASGDETARVVGELGRRQPIEYVCHPTNLGCSANIQHAIQSIETPYGCILNDDDLQLPGLVSAALETLPAHPTAGAFCGRTLVYHVASKASMRVQGTSWQPGFYRAGQATGHMVREHFTPTGVVFATPALQGARFTWGDMEMMARFAEQHDFVVSDRIFGVFAVHARSWSSSHTPEEDRRASLRRLQEYLQLETLSPDDRAEAFWRTASELVNSQLGYALHAILHGERTPPARRALASAASLAGALDTERLSLGERFQRAGIARVAGLGAGPLSGAAVLALRGISRIAGTLDRFTVEPRRSTEAERAALGHIAALDRRAEALFEGLVGGDAA